MSFRNTPSMVEAKAVCRFNGFLALFLLLFAAPFLPLLSTSAHAVTLAWTASTSTGVTGYNLYYGTTSGSYGTKVNVGNTTSYALSSLQTGATYYFAVTDYNSSGTESGYSNQISYTVSSGCTYTISPTSQSFATVGGTGSVGVTTQSGCAWKAASGAPWMTITSGSSGTGSGSVGYSVAANSGASRTAASTIASQTLTVTEAAAQTQTTYTITASAGTGGSISPSGSVSVASGSGRTFTVTHASGYSVYRVTVDGVSVGRPTSYTFSNVKANHTISASFSRSWWW